MSRAPLSFGDLEAALSADDSLAVVELFSGRTEAERRAVAPELIHWYHDRIGQRLSVIRPTTAALLACATFSELRKLGGPSFSSRYFGEETYAVLAERRPTWLEQWVTYILEHTDHGGPGWPLCRRLVRDGICDRPQTDAYILSMITGMRGYGARGRPLRQRLLDDPALLDHEIWRLFEVEGQRRGRNLTSYGRAWSIALAELGDDGVISRDRLLDATLDALERDFSAYNARWYQRFHDRLAPDLDELAARVHRYLRLLDNGVTPTVTLALDAVTTLENAGLLPAEELVRSIAPALESAPKKTAAAALKLLERVIETQPSVRPAALRAACAGFGHSDVAVQKSAMGLLGRHVVAIDPHTKGELLGFADTIAPSLRAKLEQVLGLDLAVIVDDSARDQHDRAELERRAAELPASLRALAGVDLALRAVAVPELPRGLDFSAGEVPPLASAEPIAPVDDHGELVELLSSLVEDPQPSDDLERALDGVARLCGSEPVGFATTVGPLRKRALAILNRRSGNSPLPFVCSDPRGDVCGVVVAWLTGELRQGRTAGPTLLSSRALEVAELARWGRPRSLLATPTHTGGWIDPGAMPARLAEVDVPGRADATLMILRLAPTGDTALAELDGHQGELARAIRATLGDPDVETGPTRHLWTAVTAAREAGADADTSVRIASWLYAVRSDLGASAKEWLPAHPGGLYSLTPRWVFQAAAIRWVASARPARREPFFGIGAQHCDLRMDLAPDVDEGAFVEPLLDPDQPLTPAAVHLLLVSLASRDQARQSVAVDALVAAVSDGRVDHDEIGRALSLRADHGLSRVRLARALEAVAGASVLHAECIRLLLERSFEAAPPGAPRDLHALVALLLELTADADTGIALAGAREYLVAIGRGSKAGRLARDLLALEPKASRHARPAAVAALEGRLQRGERWAAA